MRNRRRAEARGRALTLTQGILAPVASQFEFRFWAVSGPPRPEQIVECNFLNLPARPASYPPNMLTTWCTPSSIVTEVSPSRRAS